MLDEIDMFDAEVIVDSVADHLLSSTDDRDDTIPHSQSAASCMYLRELVANNPLTPINCSDTPVQSAPGLLIPHELTKRSRGGINSLAELDDYNIVCLDYSDGSKPHMTIKYDKIKFNRPCVKLFPGLNYIHMLISVKQKRIVLVPCGQYDKDALQWSVGDSQPSELRALMFAPKLYEVLRWVQDYTYQINGVYQRIKGKQTMTFNLDECYRMESKKQPIYNVEWIKSFGPLYSEHADTYRVNLDKYYLLSTSLEKPINAPEVGIVPTPNDIITKQYYLTDADEKRQKAVREDSKSNDITESVPA
ncbi:hypothetical protein FACS1894184_16070 [Clostridia bacterium]|nr:hypothetical protein FACS1894184_16070 [Clostridia bacterium]